MSSIFIPKGTEVVKIKEESCNSFISRRNLKVPDAQKKFGNFYYVIKETFYRVRQECVKVLLYILIFICMTTDCFASRDVDELTHEAREKLYELMELVQETDKDINLKLLCTFRSQKEQDKLFSVGRSSPGKKITWTRRSQHTERIAFDVAVVKEGRLSWEARDYVFLRELADKLDLIWGGNWKVRDYGHFELKRK